jgi:hypothetical protein
MQNATALFINVVEVEFSEVPIAPVRHEGGLIYRAWLWPFVPTAPLAVPLASAGLSQVGVRLPASEGVPTA